MTRTRPSMWLFVVLALIFYSLPWVVTPGVSLTMGAVDLAEWASLHPAVRAASPPLLTSFLLRLPLVVLALVVAFQARIERWLRALVVLVAAVALLPPLEFFTQYQGDPNYRQQFALAALALLGGIIGLIGQFVRWSSPIIALLALVGAVTGLSGFSQAYTLLSNFHLPVGVGFGMVGFVACCLTLAIFQLPRFRSTTKRVARA